MCTLTEEWMIDAAVRRRHLLTVHIRELACGVRFGQSDVRQSGRWCNGGCRDDSAVFGLGTGPGGRGEGEEWRWDYMAANLRSFKVSGASQDLVG
jgi:hypothetical protein